MKLTTDLLAGILKPVSELIDDLHTSVEEKAALKNEIYAATIELTSRAFEFEKELFTNQAKVVMAEANGKHWLQANWRPLTMLTFVSMMMWNWVIHPLLGQPPVEFPDWVGTAFQIGLGGYVVGRSAEKIASTVTLNSDMMRDPAQKRKDVRVYARMLRKAKTPEEREAILALLEEE